MDLERTIASERLETKLTGRVRPADVAVGRRGRVGAANVRVGAGLMVVVLLVLVLLLAAEVGRVVVGDAVGIAVAVGMLAAEVIVEVAVVFERGCSLGDGGGSRVMI